MRMSTKKSKTFLICLYPSPKGCFSTARSILLRLRNPRNSGPNLCLCLFSHLSLSVAILPHLSLDAHTYTFSDFRKPHCGMTIFCKHAAALKPSIPVKKPEKNPLGSLPSDLLVGCIWQYIL